jgi:site-specific DNA recombinase
MKGIIYVRVSSLDQLQGTSLEHQRDTCIAYARDKGIEIVEVLVEKAETATISDRPELGAALDYCRRHRVDVVIVWKIDRFARNTGDYYALKAQLARYGAKLRSANETILNEDSPTSRMAEAMLAGFAQFENEVRTERSMAGMRRRLTDGLWPWLPPLGYRRAEQPSMHHKTKPDEPDPERFHLIRRGFLDYAAGKYTITSLTAALNRWGLRTRRGTRIYKQHVDRLLQNRFYVGVLTNPWTGEEIRGQHQPMFTQDEFNRILTVKHGNSNGATLSRQIDHPDFPLRHFVRCVCGGPLTASRHQGRTGRYAYYNCFNRRCLYRHRYVPTDVLEDAFAHKLAGVTPTRDWWRVLEYNVMKVITSEEAAQRLVEKTTTQRLQSLEARRKRLLQMRMDGELEGSEFITMRDDIDRDIANLTTRITPHDVKACDNVEVLATARDVTCNLSQSWRSLKSPHLKRELQHLVLSGGISFDTMARRFRTAKLSALFSLIEASHASVSPKAGRKGQNQRDVQDKSALLKLPDGICWNDVLYDITRIAEFSKSLTQEGEVTQDSKQRGCSVIDAHEARA